MHANDNNPPSGKAARAWPAMTTAIRSGDVATARVLARFARLYETAYADPSALPSPAGRFEDSDLSLAELDAEPDDPKDDGSESQNKGYDIDRHLDCGPSPKMLARLDPADCRIVRANLSTVYDGETFRSFESWLEIRDAKGTWHRVKERLRSAKGPSRPKGYALAWTRRVHPSGKVGATSIPRAAEDRLIARDLLDELRATIGEGRFEALRMAAVERSTAQRIGELHGKTHKRASAFGGQLIREAAAVANDNGLLADVA
jgi:hypothetical protein